MQDLSHEAQTLPSSSGIVAFFQGVQEEFKKITWPGLPQVLSQTVVVLLMITVMTVFVWILDWFINWGLSFISPFTGK
ncbi:MAG: preprotein translocase subunit SecE [Vampirovibrionales bacterium]